ncbi:hypothetical protein Pmar_PMAR020510 [Perkinsus marinus ATCC 50983]|uniref:Uncharacterized protein n=1 Tax=Perkinsus marinus (strain ATCC 50983 / TXsc) TaxID=423536 RepID=C5L784_PERM5|nr:hypothetical protein Pmar_PMAR020510 [Perkinsus marinus ATCC 50983]EER07345.1 hypothetical protein Pmar_PMAR020510 [Perkinsus marinus ATCC 50983]|eukprot:XP_002775529.1 hypothetical protein Pmar_PMAR020510 [Perkinsus marinus ATCC 50983]
MKKAIVMTMGLEDSSMPEKKAYNQSPIPLYYHGPELSLNMRLLPLQRQLPGMVTAVLAGAVPSKLTGWSVVCLLQGTMLGRLFLCCRGALGIQNYCQD